MADGVCDVCKREAAVIHIDGEGKFCAKCHNERALAELGIEDTFDYDEIMTVTEQDGTVHEFKVQHLVMGAQVLWEAYELNGNYHFSEVSDASMNGSFVAQWFHQKLIDGVCTKTLEMEDGQLIGLKKKGTINIVQGEDDENAAAFEIDGRIYNGEELVQMLSSYPGLSMQYQIHDAYYGVLKEDDYLLPETITKAALCDAMEFLIADGTDDGFVSSNLVDEFGEAFDFIAKRLEILSEIKPEEAKEIGLELIGKLVNLETDDEYFPELELATVCSIVDPFGEDENINEKIRAWDEAR